MHWHKWRRAAGQQLMRANPGIVRALMHLRARPLPFDSSPGTVVVFSPHKDDEVLGCGGTIIHKCRQGAAVHIVFMTDGRASHRSRFVSPDELARLRTTEARDCAAVLGVPQEQLFFLEYEERCLAHHEAAAQAQVSGLLARLQPAEVYVPYHRETQADHGETHRLVRRALQDYRAAASRQVVLYEYFVWTIGLWFWQIAELYRASSWHRVAVREVQSLKQRALAQYRSQTTALFPDPVWPVLPKDLLTWAGLPHEYFLRAG